MKAKMFWAMSFVAALVLLNGCGGGGDGGAKETGFLSDYSKLQKGSDSSMRYVDQAAIPNYPSFIVDPVQVRFDVTKKTEGKITEQQMTDLANYMHKKIVEAVEGAGKTIVYKPGAGVARVRVALTDLKKSDVVSILPQANLMGVGIGGASMEAEVVDSVTGQQIGAVVQSGKGSRIPFTNLGDWTAAKNVIDGWAENFQKRLSE